jgi:Bax protein
MTETAKIRRFAARIRRRPLVLAGIALAVLLAVLIPTPNRLPDFTVYSQADARKQAFFQYLAPLVRAENDRIREQRERLLALADSLGDETQLGWFERNWVQGLAEQYEVEWTAEQPEDAVSDLLRRVDTVPVSLALVQAAAESGWGRSRYAVQGNNLFGHWCFEPGCGIVPSRRAPGDEHEVAKFASVSESVARYMHNLNTHPSYRPFRQLRARDRAMGKTPGAAGLADGLVMYSERREDYVREVKKMIRVNAPIIQEVMSAESTPR